MREKLEKQLRSAAQNFQKHPTAENLKKVQRQASTLQNLDPNRAREVTQGG